MKRVLCLFTAMVSLMAALTPVLAQDANDYYDAFLAVNDDVSLNELRDAGMVITARYDGIMWSMPHQQFS